MRLSVALTRTTWFMEGLREDKERGQGDMSIRVVEAWRYWAENGS